MVEFSRKLPAVSSWDSDLEENKGGWKEGELKKQHLWFKAIQSNFASADLRRLVHRVHKIPQIASHNWAQSTKSTTRLIKEIKFKYLMQTWRVALCLSVGLKQDEPADDSRFIHSGDAALPSAKMKPLWQTMLDGAKTQSCHVVMRWCHAVAAVLQTKRTIFKGFKGFIGWSTLFSNSAQKEQKSLSFSASLS